MNVTTSRLADTNYLTNLWS